MKSFPDESGMPRSQDGTDPIRGGSIGMNRILGYFVDAANRDRKSQFNAVIISAFTIFRNVWTMKTDASVAQLDEGFVIDVNLFLDYFDTYLSFVIGSLSTDHRAPVLIYFPTYKRVQKEILREHTGKQLELFKAWDAFYKRHGADEGQVRKLDLCTCYWMRAGENNYPHKDVARIFREISTSRTSLYSSGDPVCLISHIPLDLYISHRIRNISVLESYTAKVKKPIDFRFRLDKEGRIPFQSAVHVAFGDDVLIKPQVTHKARRELFEQAVKDRWLTRSEDDIRGRIAKVMGVSSGTFRKYDFI